MTAIEQERTNLEEPTSPTSIGTSDDRPRTDGPLKVTGRAQYANDLPVDNPAYLFPIVSTIARGRITSIDTTLAEDVSGVVLMMTHENAPSLRVKISNELWILQSDRVDHRGQIIGGVVADTPQAAR